MPLMVFWGQKLERCGLCHPLSTPPCTDSALAQVLEAVLERVPVTWGCYVEASGLGEGCGLAFYLQTQA